jgi:DNA-binding beta-propeller fold protein YncE
MTEDHEFQNPDKLPAPLEAAVRSALTEPDLDETIERVKARAKALNQTVPTPRPQTVPARSNDSRLIRWGAGLAAMVVALVGGVAMLMHQSSTTLFAEVIEKVKAANTVQFRMTQRFGQQPEQAMKWLIDGKRVRIEHYGGRVVAVLSEKAILIDHDDKLVEQLPYPEQIPSYVNLIDQLRQVVSGEAVAIGEEKLGDLPTRVYRVPKVNVFGISGTAEMLVWVDAQTELPAKIVIRDTDPKHPTEFRSEEFVWNEALDPQLFSLEIPDGYKLRQQAAPTTIKTPPVADANAPAIENGILQDRVPCQIVWHPDGVRLTAVMQDPESSRKLQNQLRQWDVQTGKLLWSETIAGASDVAQSADGQKLVTVIGYEVQLRDAATGKITKTWVTRERLGPLAFSVDGQTLAAGIMEWGKFGGRGGKVSGGVEFWDVEQGTLIRTVTDDSPTVDLVFSPNGKFVATTPNQGSIKVWEAATGSLVRIVPGLSCASFSPDGETIACVAGATASAPRVGIVDLYRLQDGEKLRTLIAPAGTSTSHQLHVAYSPDGRYVTASDWNGTVTVWNASSGEVVDTFDEGAGVHSAVFSPDSKTLATGCENQTLRLRPLPQ